MRFRRVLKTIFWSQRRIFMWTFMVLLIVLSWAFRQRDPIVEYQQTLQQVNEERMAVKDIETDIARLEQESRTLQEGGFEHAKVARQRYRLSKPGEHVLYLEAPDETPLPDVDSPIPEPALP
ncbi:MAG: FtsB family cell division protein [Candidatus Sumerlaeota bacterium]